jgi:LacI family transcriptional regulator
VLEAARTLDYVPNALARGLLKSHVPVVGVIVHDITDPYFAEVVRGVEDAASVGGFLVITCSSDRIAEREHSYVRLLRSMRAATLIFVGSGLVDPALNVEIGKHVTAMRAYGAAVVHLSPHADGPPEVGIDNAAGIARMVGALVELGHRRIAFLAGPSSLYVSHHRLEGYRQGLAAAGIAYDDQLVLRTGFNREGGKLGIDTLLAGDVPFTAICAATDLLALGALQRLAELEIHVPGEVSVAGFDDIQTAAMATPSLSTVRLPLHEIGRRAFGFAERLLAGDEPAPEVLPTELILRGSTAPPPRIALALASRAAAASPSIAAP